MSDVNAELTRSAPPGRGWQASLHLGFTRRDERTVLSARAHRGPLQVQRPFYPEGPEFCHVYLIHPPGGLVGGDELRLDVMVDPGAHAVLTTPAANKLYRSAGANTRQSQHLRVAAGASLEWLPAETIAFDGARSSSFTFVELAQGATFVGWDVTCLGRPACSETLTNGVVRQRLELWQAGKPLFVERSAYDGGDPILREPWGLGARPVTATLVATTTDDTSAAAVRSAVEPAGADQFGVTWRSGVLICRASTDSTGSARAYLAQAWAVLRPLVLGRAPSYPRIWNT